MWKQTRLLFSSLLLTSFIALAGFSQEQLPPSANHPSDLPNDLTILLKKIGERAAKYQEDLYNLAWTQANNWQPLTDDLKPKGKAKETVYDAVMLRKPSATNPQVLQPALRFELKSVDGKPAKEKKVVQNSPEQYGQANGHYQLFLLPERQSQYTFTREGETTLQGREAIILAMSPVSYAKPQLKIEKCHFQVTPIPFPRKGKIWVEADTFNVLQVKWELVEAFGAHVNFGVCVKGIFPITRPNQDIVYERFDTIIRFQAIAFREPDQTLLLPSKIEETHVIKGARNPASRITVAFTDYKRFGSDVKFTFPDKDGQ
jgi:hypothetical protein